ncbi:head maturation protease, ClpP-related [Bacillus cereus]|uniref:head maturation protease, ClpP-related n=1 Tax=Bacillus cereus TaxID=1396 RepID=UPI00289DE5B8|nr:head maturation protease, ClpP-related [Bacillus cereus]
MYGNVGKAPFGDISAQGVREMLDGVTNDIEIRINSNGGDAFEGIAICNYLKNHPSNVTAVIDAMGASSASLIAMGANKIAMPSNAIMMVHRASTYAYGNADSLEKKAKMLRDVDDALIQTYRNRFNGEFHELEALLDNETYMTAEVAKSYGLIDEITDSVENSVESEPVIENKIEEPVAPIENEGDKRIQNAERSANFMASLLKSIKL